MVDTGASISTIKIGSLYKNDQIDSKYACKVTGISGKLKTLGTIDLKLFTREPRYLLEQGFHVLSDNCSIYADGILGANFLKKFKANINYDNFTLTLIIQDLQYTVPLKYKNNSSIYNIPARTEKIMKMETKVNEEVIIKSEEISERVFVANSLAKPINGFLYFSVINTTNENVEIDNIILNLEKSNNFDIIKFGKIGKNESNRSKELLSELNLNGLSGEENSNIKNLCCEFSDIFHLPGDKLTVTNLCKQEIHLKENMSPKYIKQYRLPFALRDEVSKLTI